MNTVDKIKYLNCGNGIEAQLKSEYSVQNSKLFAETKKLNKDDLAVNISNEKESEFLKRLEPLLEAINNFLIGDVK